MNIGTLENKGFEFVIGYDVIQKQKFYLEYFSKFFNL